MLAHLVNARDLGGLPLIGGGVTRYEVLYRGDAPHPGDLAPDGVRRWPPATVVDLRSPEESARIGHTWSAGSVVHQHPLHDAAAPDARRPDTLAGVYVAMVSSAPRLIAAAVGLIARSDGPVFVHCTLGKDRTGVVVAAVLLTVGVEPDAVVGDYLATAAGLPDLRNRLRTMATRSGSTHPRRVDRSFLDVTEEGIRSVVSTITDWPGGPIAWCIDHGAPLADIETLRDRLRQR